VHKADFERLLATRSRGRSAHFAVHHVTGAPAVHAQARPKTGLDKLSTTGEPICAAPVDKLPAGHWLGCVVPKRQARRSVTRNLLKRQMRETFRRHAPTLPQGLWLLRLHAGFAVRDFPAARSDALAEQARLELEQLLAKAAAA
jgi:ribonuclease P protein component